jgi:hypothetical protein
MSTDEKILQALTEQEKLLTALHADMTTVKGVQQEQGNVLGEHGNVLAGLSGDMTTVKATLHEHGQELGAVSSKLTRIEKDIQLVLKYHDENVLHLRSRIERLEEHAGVDNS